MRPLEIAVTVVLLPYVLHLLSPSRGESAWFNVFPFMAALLIVCHVAAEGYRWQMVPVYGLTTAFVAYACARWFWAFHAPYVAGVVSLLFVLASIALCTLLPVFKIPAPAGPYRIGTQVRHIVDESRLDPFSDISGGARELMIQIWYPVEPSVRGEIAPYRDHRITRFKDAHFALVESHSVLGAQFAHSQGRYPVLLYAPSWNGVRTESTFQIEELASHGYVVVGMDHPYSSRITVFPDGRIARRKFVGEEDYSSQAGLEAFIKTADQQVEIRARDASFVLDTLDRLNANDPQGLLTGRLDLDQVGIFGFSFGGSTAAEACRLDRRFKAGLDFDGMIAGESAKQGTVAPFFFMFQNSAYGPETDLSRFDASKRREIEFGREQEAQMKRSLSKYGGYWMEIPGITHLEFSDFPFYSPLRFSGLPFLSSLQFSRMDPERTARTISRYTVAFFNKQVKRIEQPLLDGSFSDTSGAYLQVWKAKAPAAHLGR